MNRRASLFCVICPRLSSLRSLDGGWGGEENQTGVHEHFTRSRWIGFHSRQSELSYECTLRVRRSHSMTSSHLAPRVWCCVCGLGWLLATSGIEVSLIPSLTWGGETTLRAVKARGTPFFQLSWGSSESALPNPSHSGSINRGRLGGRVSILQNPLSCVFTQPLFGA